MKGAPSIFHIGRLDLSFAPKIWTFAAERRAEIDAYFEAVRREKPTLWNGRVLLLHRQVVEQGVLRGQYLETDYASFAAWRHWGRPAAGVRDCFSAAALRSADSAFLVAVMGPHTFNAGRIYFPCGTPDPNDVVADKVDLDLSVRRELKEETGLDIIEFDAEAGWDMVVDGPLIALIKVLRSTEKAIALRERVLAHLAREEKPELADVRIVRGQSDFDHAMPDFVRAFLTARFAAG
jgi:8-oxo-dGTP pyrophosphatase MutT (NUDIX family)